MGTVVSILGSALIALSDWNAGDHGLYGDLLALSGAMAMSGYLLIGRRQRQHLDLVPYIGVVYTTAAIVLIAMAAAAGHTFTGYSDRTYVLFALLALGPQLLGHTSFNLALERLPPSAVALALLAEPIGSTLLAYIVLAEAPAAALYAGAGIILTGIGLAVWPRVPTRPSPAGDL